MMSFTFDWEAAGAYLDTGTDACVRGARARVLRKMPVAVARVERPQRKRRMSKITLYLASAAGEVDAARTEAARRSHAPLCECRSVAAVTAEGADK